MRIGGGQLVGEISDFALKVSQLEKQEIENQKVRIITVIQFKLVKRNVVINLSFCGLVKTKRH